jgi:hypothetical protein
VVLVQCKHIIYAFNQKNFEENIENITISKSYLRRGQEKEKRKGNLI